MRGALLRVLAVSIVVACAQAVCLAADFPATVLVKSVRVQDVNGDLDSWADTNETVDLYPTVTNKTGQPLTNLVITVFSRDPKLDCVEIPTAVLASLPAGGEAETPTAIRIHVHPKAERGGPAVVCDNPGPAGRCSNFVPVAGGCTLDTQCRKGPGDDYWAQLDVAMTSDQFATLARTLSFTIDLDLNASQTAGPTATFQEGFEVGFGNFTFQNLDASRASNALSDGFRCQYNDPDNPESASYGDTFCYLGFATGQTPLNDWHVHTTSSPDGGRAYLGSRSAHWGRHTPGQPDLDTYALSQLEAIRTKSSVALAARVCRDDPSPDKAACGADSDCLAVGGGPCVNASPELSFKQQISLDDDRYASNWGASADRGVVMARFSGGTWQKIEPYMNVYTHEGDIFSNCMFDPVDDGNNEDSLDSTVGSGSPWPGTPLGPSSTCLPEFVFAYLGDTDEPFSPTNIGKASDGPGLAGDLGPGTWVESRFDLSRWRGRSVELRFLMTTIKVEDFQTVQNVFQLNPSPFDDGWYVDDVRLTQTVNVAPTLAVDEADNSALPGNLDGDPRGDLCDCAPASAGAFAVPPEVPGPIVWPDKGTLGWSSVLAASGPDTVHEVARGALSQFPVGSGASEICLGPGIASNSVSDPEVPSAGGGFWYLPRGRNQCGAGTYGRTSSGVERITAACP